MAQCGRLREGKEEDWLNLGVSEVGSGKYYNCDGGECSLFGVM